MLQVPPQPQEGKYRIVGCLYLVRISHGIYLIQSTVLQTSLYAALHINFVEMSNLII